jgi:cytochrome b pre-mRNA-processing protein 3
MRRESETTAEVAQALFDLMFADMDQNLREMGVGDIGVGKRVKAMAQAFYGRLASYGAGLDHPQDDSLANALQRNLFRKVSPTDRQVTAVAGYVRREASFLDDQATPSLVVGSIDFGPPPTMDRGESR